MTGDVTCWNLPTKRRCSSRSASVAAQLESRAPGSWRRLAVGSVGSRLVLQQQQGGDEGRQRAAQRRVASLSGSLCAFDRAMLLLEDPETAAEADREEQRRFVGKFQQ